MKSFLVLFLLLSPLAWGQDFMGPPVQLKVTYRLPDIVELIRYDSTGAPVLIGTHHIMTFENTLAEWSAFKQECFADSTRHDRLDEGWLPLTFYGTILGDVSDADLQFLYRWSDTNNAIERRPRFYVTHKDPNDLPGFMEFLTKRYGRK